MAPLDGFPLPLRLRYVLDDALLRDPSASPAAPHPTDGALLDAYSTTVSAAVAPNIALDFALNTAIEIAVENLSEGKF